MGSPLTVDRNFDYRVDVTYMGSTIHDGVLPWRGKLYRLMTAVTCTTVVTCGPDGWGVDPGGGRIPTEVLNTFDLGGTLTELGPISTSPSVAIDDNNKLWVFGGTGRYFGAPDKTNTEQQYFFGVKDEMQNGGPSAGCTHSKTGCHSNDLVDVSGAQVCLVGAGDCGSGTDQVTGVMGATDFPSLINLVATKEGWVTKLGAANSGERANARPLVFGGLVLFPTFTPTNDPCSSSGTAKLYALYYLTGSAYSAPIIGTTDIGSGKKEVNSSTDLGAGIASQVVVHIGHGGGNGKTTAYVQKSTGENVGHEARRGQFR